MSWNFLNDEDLDKTLETVEKTAKVVVVVASAVKALYDLYQHMTKDDGKK